MECFLFVCLMCLLVGILILTSSNFVSQHSAFKKAFEESAMSDQNWANIVDNYLQSKRKGALIISGAWGTGKTYLFEHTIAKCLSDKRIGVKHVSLYSYGVNGKTLDDIIIQEVIGVADVDSDSKQGAQALITGALSFFSSSENSGVLGAAVSTVGGAIKRRIVAGLESQVICFDDLDRLSPDLMYRAWSEINFFTEIKSWKVVILIDESRLPGGSVYTPELEKNVWGVIPLDVTPRSALDIGCKTLHRDVMEPIGSILESHFFPVVDHLKVINIRTVIMALEKVSYVVCILENFSDQRFESKLLSSLYQKIFLCALIPREGIDRVSVIASLSSEVDVQGRIMERTFVSSGTDELDVSPEQQFIDELPNFISLPISMPFLPAYLTKGLLQPDALIACLVSHANEKKVEFVGDDLFALASIRGTLDAASYLEFGNSVLGFLSSPPPGNYSLTNFSAIAFAVLGDAYYGGLSQGLDLVEAVVSKGTDVIISGIEAETHFFATDSLTPANFSAAISSDMRQCIWAIKNLAEKKNELRDFYISLQGWQSDPELKALAEALNGFRQPALFYIGYEELRDFVIGADGRTVNTFNWILGRRYAIDGAVGVIGQEVDVLAQLLSFYRRYDSKGYHRVAIKSGIPMLEHAVVHSKRFKNK